jgi:hypothetical protein
MFLQNYTVENLGDYSHVNLRLIRNIACSRSVSFVGGKDRFGVK